MRNELQPLASYPSLRNWLEGNAPRGNAIVSRILLKQIIRSPQLLSEVLSEIAISALSTGAPEALAEETDKLAKGLAKNLKESTVSQVDQNTLVELVDRIYRQDPAASIREAILEGRLSKSVGAELLKGFQISAEQEPQSRFNAGQCGMCAIMLIPWGPEAAAIGCIICGLA